MGDLFGIGLFTEPTFWIIGAVCFVGAGISTWWSNR